MWHWVASRHTGRKNRWSPPHFLQFFHLPFKLCNPGSLFRDDRVLLFEPGILLLDPSVALPQLPLSSRIVMPEGYAIPSFQETSIFKMDRYTSPYLSRSVHGSVSHRCAVVLDAGQLGLTSVHKGFAGPTQ